MLSISIILISFIIVQHSSGFYLNNPKSDRYVTNRQYVSALMPPADLTPAVDKYPTLPTYLNDVKVKDQSLPFVTAQGPAPTGPEPFSFVSSEVQPLADYVKELIKSENPVLTMAASHFFEQVK
jgi:hypothetical protein